MLGAAWAAFKISRAFKPVLGIAAVVAILGLVFMLGKCSGGNDGEAAQAEQTSRSGAAITEAAQAAIATIGNRTVTENSVDDAVGEAITEINNADDINAIRDTVLVSVCGQASHRNDPACRVQPTTP